MSTEKKDCMLIKLTRGRFTKVDPWNFHRLNQYKWYCENSRNVLYATRKTKKKEGGKRRDIRMHNQIKTAPPGFELDHINRNSLDNREANIRIVTHQQNLMNCKVKKQKSSRYKGVIFHKHNKKWCASITKNYKKIHIGYFQSEEEAATAYDDAAFRYHGLYAYLNFPKRYERKVMQALL